MSEKSNAMNVLEKLRTLSRKTRRKFDDLPDMRKDGSIERFNVSDFTKETISIMQEDAKNAGFDLEVKIVGVAVRVVMLDPDDKSRTKIVTTEIAITHPDIDLNDLLSTSDSIDEINGDRLLHKHNDDEPPYKPEGKYDGHMYG